jgi:excinuclease ABC subunit A
VRHDTPETIYAELQQRAPNGRPAAGRDLPGRTAGQHQRAEQVEQWLSASGFTKVQAEREGPVGAQAAAQGAGRGGRPLPLGNAEKARVIEAIEVALKRGGGGRLNVYRLVRGRASPSCGASPPACTAPTATCATADPSPSAFSFNSAVGACDTCRGFGRVIGVDYGLVIPNDKLTLRAGAIKPMQTPAWKECQDDLMRHAEAAGIPRDTPWNKLTAEQKRWVIDGSPNWNGKWNQQWYGIKRFL